MKSLYIDCTMGIDEGSLAGALYELLDEGERQAFIEKINAIGIAPITVDKVSGGSIIGVVPTPECAESIGRTIELSDIDGVLSSLPISDGVRVGCQKICGLLSDAVWSAECSTASITGGELLLLLSVCILIEMLGEVKISASEVQLGTGFRRTALGAIPTPTPATARLLSGVPICVGDLRGECCTPLGAAIIKHLAEGFGRLPMTALERVGYGIAKDSEGFCRAILGYEVGDEQIYEFTCTIDDMTPEKIAAASEMLFALGALEVYTAPVVMKKSRLGTMLTVMCRGSVRERIIRGILEHTTTIGVRESVSNRYALNRRIEARQTPLGEVRVKCSEGFGIYREKYEYEDVFRLAKENGISLDEAEKIIARYP